MSGRRTLLRASAAALLGAGAGPLLAQSQDYPSRPIRLVVAWPAGGPADIVGRTLASALSSRLGQEMIVDNRGGANGNIGAQQAARSAPDGYTLFLVASSHAANMTLYSKTVGYDLTRDFVPIAPVLSSPFVLVVNPSVKANSVAELVALAKAQPGKLTYGSAGSGGGAHLAAELFKSMTGTDILHVPYKGTAPALVDLVGGQVNMMFASVTGTLEHVKAGRLRVLGITGSARSQFAPDIPTVAEAGVPGYSFAAWFGVMAPAGTPAPIVSRLHAEIDGALKTRTMSERLAADGSDVMLMSTPQFGDFVKSEIGAWARLIRISGSKVD